MGRTQRQVGQHFIVFVACGLVGLGLVFAAGLLSSLQFHVVAFLLVIIAWVLFSGAMGAVALACLQELIQQVRWYRSHCGNLYSVVWASAILSLSFCATALIVAFPFLVWFVN